ncbi:MAG: hypothetical protein SF053_14880 [Bacteroidia bacterium]|jgi:hypothetical protein|nr:hypothetical protein [Bacteroidia bacterium]
MPSLLPGWILALFIVTTLVTGWLFFRAIPERFIRTPLIITLIWMGLQALLGLSEFYLVSDTLPPRAGLLIIPVLLLMVYVFIREHAWLDSLDLGALTAIHLVRIPVELVLWGLHQVALVPKLMTFEGQNFDILIGLSAILVLRQGFVQPGNTPRRIWLIVWNLVGLIFLLNIVVLAVLSLPTQLQQLAFEQPNLAVMYFPFVWLPAFIVPVVMLSHLAALRQLLRPGARPA